MKESVRIMRFVIIGTSNAAILASVIWVMMSVLDCNYMASNVVAYICALINNFFWSKYWVFTSKDGSYWREVPLFLTAFGCAYGMQFLALLLMVEVLDLNQYLAQFLGMFVYGAVNFFMNRFVTFKKGASVAA